MITRKLTFLFLLTSAVIVSTAFGQDDTVKVPDEVKPFVEKPLVPIALESGDLNGDGRKDFILVLSEVIKDDAEWEEGGGARSVLILVRGADNKLLVAGRNEEAAMCKNCGGVFGDPFAGVSIKGTSFTVSNYGGSNDRWAYDYTFAYSRRDNNWQLVRVVETTFHALDPARTEKKRVYTPPKSFGLINFADFKPEDYLGKGKK
jgi:hypothetical protein